MDKIIPVLILLYFFLPFLILGVILLIEKLFDKLIGKPLFYLIFGGFSSLLNVVLLVIGKGAAVKVISLFLSSYYLIWGIYLYSAKKANIRKAI